MVQNTESLLMN